MKITFISPRFYPEIGGVEKHAFEVAKRLIKKYEVTIITESTKRNKKEKIQGINIQRFYFGKNSWFKKFRIWFTFLKFRKIIEKADIVHCHDVFFWYLPLRIIYPRKKIYVTFHGYETIFPLSGKAIFIRKLSEKLSKGNICIGEYIKKWYGTNPTIVSYGGVNNKHSKTKKIGSRLKILFIGRIEEDTGVKIYLEVLRKLKNFKFEACGDGIFRKEFEKYGKVHGFVKKMDKYIQNSDVIFASSYLSMLEAMSFKKPVFSVYNNPLKKDYLKMTPFDKWIYVSNSTKILVNKIKAVSRNNKLRERNQNLAYNWVKDQSWDKITKDYLRLWKVI